MKSLEQSLPSIFFKSRCITLGDCEQLY